MLNEETAFLKAIAREPDEDLNRLAYADWLTEYGGDPARAELIQIQCGLERGIDWRDNAPAEGERLEEIRARERELIEKMLTPDEAGEEPGVREFTTTPEIAAILAADHSRITFKRGMIDHLYLYSTAITELPSGLQVGDDLDLWLTNITKLPEDLRIGGNLDLSGTYVTELPPDLHVGGNLKLSRTLITKLPAGLHVGGNLDLSETLTTELPPGLHVCGDLDLWSTNVTELPPDLHVGGSLHLGGTNFTAETAGRILDMPKDSRQIYLPYTCGAMCLFFSTLHEISGRLFWRES